MKSFFLFCCIAIALQEVYATESDCQKSELLLFFPRQIVEKALIQANINEKQAENIALELSLQNKEIEQKIKEQAEKMEPNPLSDLSQRDRFLRIYQELLLATFSSVLKKNGIQEEGKAKELLEKVREEKSRQLIECLQAAK